MRNSPKAEAHVIWNPSDFFPQGQTHTEGHPSHREGGPRDISRRQVHHSRSNRCGKQPRKNKQHLLSLQGPQSFLDCLVDAVPSSNQHGIHLHYLTIMHVCLPFRWLGKASTRCSLSSWRSGSLRRWSRHTETVPGWPRLPDSSDDDYGHAACDCSGMGQNSSGKLLHGQRREGNSAAGVSAVMMKYEDVISSLSNRPSLAQ